MAPKLDYPLVITGNDNKPLRLVCCALNCTREAVENRADEFGNYPLCRFHCDEDDMIAAAEHGASRECA